MSKKWMIYIGIALVVFLAIGGYLLWGVKDYIDKVPHIVPRENVTAETTQVLTAHDLFEVECKGSYTLKLEIIETDIEDAAVGEGGATLYVGSSKGTIRVRVLGTGEVAEHVDAENIVTIQ